MQVLAINNTNRNYNTSFGDMQGIVCHGAFSKSNPKHALAINEVLKSDAFKKFGEMYDYIARFELSEYIEPGLENYYYSLELAPIKESSVEHTNKKSLGGFLRKLFGKEQDEVAPPLAEEKTPQLPNLPLQFIVCNSSDRWEYEAYNKFMKKLKSEDLDSLKYSLDSEIRDTEEEQKKAQKLNDTYQQAFKNINDSEIPVY